MTAVHVYVVLVEDRHSDPGVEVFWDKAAAIRWARGFVEDSLRHPEDLEIVELNNAMIRDGWQWHARYSSEGDCVTVLCRALHQEGLE